jgi:hypothetical protein
MLRRPFDGELRIEATRLSQRDFRPPVIPPRGLRCRQIGVGIKNPVAGVNCSFKLFNRRVKPMPANLGNAQGRMPDAAQWIAGAQREGLFDMRNGSQRSVLPAWAIAKYPYAALGSRATAIWPASIASGSCFVRNNTMLLTK